MVVRLVHQLVPGLRRGIGQQRLAARFRVAIGDPAAITQGRIHTVQQFIDMRAQAQNMHDEDMADWSEAYAANMVAYAQQIQDEASNAVAAAAEARAKANAAKTA